MVSWEYLWPTLRCRRLVVPLFGVPKRHCCRVSAADKGCRVYPLDPRSDAVALYSRCTLEAGKLIALQSSQPYAEAVKSSYKNSSTQTDENITKIKCPPLKILQPLSSKPRTKL
ncbi:uncharacterized protein TNCV_315221 [Trichonephila clavipes]|nr:uncharacterized protein TNCV_315221 [Trichonephila clavipes]